MNSELSFIEVFKQQTDYFKEDYKVYWVRNIQSEGFFTVVISFLTCHGLHMMFLYRLGRIIYAIKIPILSHILKAFFLLIQFFFTTFYGIHLGVGTGKDLGPGFYIGHFGGIIIGGKFGRNCSVSQGVTVGNKGAGKSDGSPTFGDNVYIAAGAKVIGRVNIGSNVVIGANAVVITDIPDNSIAVGVPAKIKPIPQKSE